MTESSLVDSTNNTFIHFSLPLNGAVASHSTSASCGGTVISVSIPAKRAGRPKKVRAASPNNSRTSSSSSIARLDDAVAHDKVAVLHSEDFKLHRVPDGHQERPERVEWIMESLQKLQQQFPDQLLFFDESHFEEIDFDAESLNKAHTKDYLLKMRSRVPKDDKSVLHATWRSLSSLGNLVVNPPPNCVVVEKTPAGAMTTATATPSLLSSIAEAQDTFMSSNSWSCAMLAAGAVCRAVDFVMRNECDVKRAFACVRPPGHHSGANGRTAAAETQGFCLINNVAVAAHYARITYGLKRVAVFDFDVHHGNGTEEILSGVDGFLFQQVYADFDFVHSETKMAQSDNVQSVLLKHRNQSEWLHKSISSEIIPKLREFQPELIIISAGFDAHISDRMNRGRGSLIDADFEQMTLSLVEAANELCEGRIVSALEGGYSESGLKGGVFAHITGLLHLPSRGEGSTRVRRPTKRKRWGPEGDHEKF